MSENDRSRADQVRWYALLAATAIALYLCWAMLKPFIGVLLWAVVLVIVFFPVHRRIEARLGRPSLSAALSCLLVIMTILVPLTFLTWAVVRELTGFAQNLQTSLGSLLDPNSPVTGPLLRRVGQYVDIEQLRSQEVQQFLSERLKGIGGSLASQTLGFVGGAAGFIIEVFFVIFTMYYLFRDGDRIRDASRRALPLRRRKASEVLARTNEVIGASVYGVLVIAAIQGLLGGVAFWALGLPSPLLWGVVMIILSMIPLAGAFIVWVPAALYLGLSGEVLKAVLLAAWGALVIGSVDNFLRPKLVGEKTRLHELLIFFSVLGGLHVFGVLGLVLGPVLVAITIALIEILRQADDAADDFEDDDAEEKSLMEEQADLRDVTAETP